MDKMAKAPACNVCQEPFSEFHQLFPQLRKKRLKKLKNPIDTYPEKCYITCAALKGPK